MTEPFHLHLAAPDRARMVDQIAPSAAVPEQIKRLLIAAVRDLASDGPVLVECSGYLAAPDAGGASALSVVVRSLRR